MNQREKSIVEDLKAAALHHKVEIDLMKFPSNFGHVHIKGKLLVNYYPLSMKRSAYVAGTVKGIQNVTPEQAVLMALAPPKVVPAEQKAKRRQNTRKIRARMMKGQESCECHWCKCTITLDTSTIDHVIPIHRGGLDNANNLVLSCAPCNQRRGHEMLELKENYDEV